MSDEDPECPIGPRRVHHTVVVSTVNPAPDASPAQWLLRPRAEWADTVSFGPPGFETYLRISFTAEKDTNDTDRAGVGLSGEDPVLRLALQTLAAFTARPDRAYAAVWEGWTNAPPPRAPRVLIPNRTMLLFTGPVAELRDAPALAWYGSADGMYEEPHLVWPADRAWCLACEVDEEVEFTVGCSEDAARALIEALPVPVRRVAYGEPVPLLKNPAEDT